ncbi:MAG: hypothetical protein AABZ60_16550 [Planctomycetota bacterium]
MSLISFLVLVGQCAVALFFLCNVFFITHTLSFKILKKSPLWIHYSAALVLGLWGATALFHLLRAFSLFHWFPALILISIASFLLQKTGTSLTLWIQGLAKEWRLLQKLHRFLQKRSGRWIYFFLKISILLLLLRVAILPPLGWDGQTFHLVKAGMWVQNGGNITLEAPGGWSFHRFRLSGGEVFSAWAMLFFHRDLLVGISEFLEWLCLGMTFFALGKEMGLSFRYSFLASSYLLSIPIIFLAVGSGYIELLLNLSLTLAFLFLIRFLRKKSGGCLLLSFMAFGVALGVQLTSWPLFFFFLVFLTPFLWRCHSSVLRYYFLLGLFFSSLVILPWNFTLWKETGYPFGHIDFKLGPLKLGEGTPELQWALSFPGLLAYDIRAEIYTFLTFFRFPYQLDLNSYATLSPFTLFPLLFFALVLLRATPLGKNLFFLGGIFFLALLLGNVWFVNACIVSYSNHKTPLDSLFFYLSVGIFDLLCLLFLGYLLKKRDFFIHSRLDRSVLFFFTGVAILIIAMFYHPQFASRRLFWGGNCTRFLFPLIGPALLISLSWCNRQLIPAILYQSLLWMGVCCHFIQCAFYGWATFEFLVIPSLLVLFFVLGFLFKRAKRLHSVKSCLVLFLLFWLLGLPLLETYRNQIRHKALTQSSIYQFVPTHWIPAVSVVDQTSQPLNIAVTSGPHKFADHWFMYFFLGHELQNRLFYIPITFTRQIVPLHPSFFDKRFGNFLSWFQRIRDQKIDYVMSFDPCSIELEWMREHPESFEFVVGEPLIFGLYRIKSN